MARNTAKKKNDNPKLFAVPDKEESLVCPQCLSQNRRKHGLDKHREQKYKCKDCGRTYTKHSEYIPPSEVPVNLSCPSCDSSNIIKRGFNRGQQQYGCKDCKRVFLPFPKSLPLEVPPDFDFSNDIWSHEQLGRENTVPHRQEKYYNFSDISQNWLKEYSKQFIYNSHDKTLGTCSLYLDTLRDFSRFLSKLGHFESIQEIARSVILDYISDLEKRNLSYHTKSHRLYQLNTFFVEGKLNGWFNINPSSLIYKKDYPKKTKKFPRYIPEEVLNQLDAHLDDLPQPVLRMVLIIRECGLRVGELCQLPLNCLYSDGKNQWRIQFMQWKMNKEHTIPISYELAQVIEEQQKYIRLNLSEDFPYLFCRSQKGKEFKPIPKIMRCENFIAYLKRLAEKYDIKDSSGKRWNFTSHQFRHTVGTQMINSGVPQHIVQRYLGHESPEMTMVYAHIYDETLRKEIEKYHDSRTVNFQGETVELEETVLSSNDDLEWFKKNVQARALEHGYCARPKVLGDCDIPGFDGCYTCPHWRTNKNFLPILEDTLERTNKVIEKARNCRWELQVKKNEPIKENLEKVIQSLEEEGESDEQEN